MTRRDVEHLTLTILAAALVAIGAIWIWKAFFG